MPLHHNVHAIDVDVLQDAGVVRDDDERAVAGLAVLLDAAGHDAERVDVEAGVGLVQDGQFRLEKQKL